MEKITKKVSELVVGDKLAFRSSIVEPFCEVSGKFILKNHQCRLELTNLYTKECTYLLLDEYTTVYVFQPEESSTCLEWLSPVQLEPCKLSELKSNADRVEFELLNVFFTYIQDVDGISENKRLNFLNWISKRQNKIK